MRPSRKEKGDAFRNAVEKALANPGDALPPVEAPKEGEAVQFQVRRGCPNDFGFIQRWWLQALHDDAVERQTPEALFMGRGDFVRWSQARLNYILTTDGHRDEIGEVVVRVAHLAGEDEERLNALVGFVVAVPAASVLHFVFVHPKYRGYGIARDLVEEVLSKDALDGELRITHLTEAAIKARERLNLRYLPL